jgi:hypothetical protein
MVQTYQETGFMSTVILADPKHPRVAKNLHLRPEILRCAQDDWALGLFLTESVAHSSMGNSEANQG